MRQTSLLLWAWINTTRSLGRGRLWGPFLLYALLQSATIFVLTQFYQPWLSPVLVPILRALGGEGVLHYPVLYLALPVVFSRLSLVLDLVFGAWLFGAAFLFCWQSDRPTEPENSGMRPATAAWGKLMLARLPESVVLALLIIVLPSILFGSDMPGGWASRGIRYGSIVVGSMIEALFIYAPLAILVEGRGVVRAIGRSFELTARIPVATFFAVLIPNLIQVPLSYAMNRSETIVARLSPEVVAWVIVFSVLAYSVATFYIVGAGARLFRVQTEGAER